MKKFLLAVIILIPVMVVMVLSATGTIIAAAKDVNATSIEIRDEDNAEIANNSQLYMDLNDEEGITIYINVYPTITYDDSVTYEMSSDENYPGEVSMARIGDTDEYRIYPVASGATRVIIRASNNREVYFAIDIYILSDEISSVLIYDNEGETILTDMEATSYPTYNLSSISTLYALAYPTDAIADNIVWESSDKSIVTVSENGTLTPLKRGKAIVSATIMQKSGDEIVVNIIIDTNTAVLITNEIYASFTVDENYIAENVVVDVTDGDVLNALEITAISGGYSVTLGGYTDIVYVYQATAGDWCFYDVPDVVYTNNGSYALSSVLKEDVTATALAGVTYSIVADNMGIASVENGYLTPLLSGTITLVATYNSQTVSKEITIYDNLSTFVLSLGQEDGELGIEMTRVWGFLWFTDTTYKTTTSSYQLTTDVVDGSADLRWTSSNTEWAEVDSTGLVSFYTAGAGQSITITAEVYINNFATGVLRSFTFNMTEETNSYNVGTNITNDDEEKNENFDILYSLTRSKYGNTIVLQGNVNFVDRIYLTASLYGNGFTIDGQYYEDDASEDEVMVYIRSEAVNYLETDGLYIQNITISGTESFETSDYIGTGIRTSNTEFEFYLMYSVVRYVNTGVVLARVNSNVVIEGSILGDCSFVGLSIATEGELTEYTLRITDCVFKETGGPSIMASSYNALDDSDYLNTNILPYIEFTGFLDIYNWKETSDLSSIVGSLDSVFDMMADFGVDPTQITSALGQIFENVFMQESNSNAVYTYEGKTYVSLGFVSLGCYVANDESRISIEDSGLELVTINMPDSSDKSIVGLALAGAEIIIKYYINGDMTLYNPSQLVTYNLDADGGPRNDPGDTVPQNTELYYKLNGKTEPEDSNKGQALNPEIIEVA
ncbi:MAG: Ig-like domain-containing protein [Bacillota bacterium]